jgi:hypothetical protein
MASGDVDLGGLDRVDVALLGALDDLDAAAERFLLSVGRSVGAGPWGDLARGRALAMLADLARDASVERVREARAGGLPWTVIGDAFGISKQSAQGRFRYARI